MKKMILWCLSLMMVLNAALPQLLAQDRTTRNNDDDAKETRVKGRILKTYSEADTANSSPQSEASANTARKQRPLWVESAVQRSLDFLNKSANPTSEQTTEAAPQNRRDARKDFALVSAEQDDLGFTHVRLNQSRNGVRVYGAQVITHLAAKNMAAVSGHELEAPDVETTPVINNANALTAAKAAVKFNGKFENEPKAELVILPNSLFKDDEDKGATLVYHVELQIEDGTDATAHHQYFISAADGSVVWHFNSLDHGTGYSLYSGAQAINTRSTFSFPFFKYSMIDDARGDAEVRNNTGGVFQTNIVDVWGNGLKTNAETVAVDASFGMAKTWDYFRFLHGRLGIDGLGYKMVARVHYGTNYNNAFWNGSVISLGDGNGTQFSPLVSIRLSMEALMRSLRSETIAASSLQFQLQAIFLMLMHSSASPRTG